MKNPFVKGFFVLAVHMLKLMRWMGHRRILSFCFLWYENVHSVFGSVKMKVIIEKEADHDGVIDSIHSQRRFTYRQPF